MTKSLDITGEEQDSFADFMTWIENYNDYIINAYSEKSSRHNDEDDELIVDGVVDIELDEEVA